MPLYKAFGLIIDSEIELPLLPTAKPDTQPKNPLIKILINKNLRLPKEYKKTITFTKVDSSIAIYYRKSIGIFNISKRRIIFKPESLHNLDDINRVICGLPAGYLLMLNSYLVFHASAVSGKKYNIIFCGKSATGKSTITSELIEKGYKFITEDICAIKNNILLVSYPYIKLSNIKGSESFLFSDKKIDYPTDSLDRNGYKIKDRFIASPNSKKKICYIFLKDKSLKIERLSTNYAIKYLFKNTFKSHPIYLDIDYTRYILKKIAKFAQETNVYAVYYNENSFEKRNRLIIKHLEDLNDQSKS